MIMHARMVTMGAGAAACVAMALSGCGGGSTASASPSGATGGSPAAAAPSSTTAAAPRSADASTATTARSSSAGGTTAAVQSPKDAVAAAYRATTRANTAHIREKLVLKAGGKSMRMTESGVVQFHPPAMSMAVTTEGKTVQVRRIGQRQYVRLPGGHWTAMKAQLPGQSSSALGQPGRPLAYLRQASSKVTSLGKSTIGGQPTTGYRVVVDLNKAAAHAPNAASRKAIATTVAELGRHLMPMTIWVDGQGRLVREQLDLSVKVHGTRLTIESTTGLSDFGAPVHINKP